jgi:hypothetical protein
MVVLAKLFVKSSAFGSGAVGARQAVGLSAGLHYRNDRLLSINPGTLDHVYWINEICIRMSTALICIRWRDVIC